MRIPRALYDELIAHALEEAPNECVGMIAAREDEAVEVHRARNAAATWLRYELHPTDQLRIMNQLEEDGEDLVGIYHSHTNSEAYPSQTDVNLADAWPDPLYLICSLEHADEPVVRAFAIRDGGVEEVELDVG